MSKKLYSVFLLALFFVACGGEVQGEIALNPIVAGDTVVFKEGQILVPQGQFVDFNQCIIVKYGDDLVYYPDLTLTAVTTTTLGFELPLEHTGDIQVTGTPGICGPSVTSTPVITTITNTTIMTPTITSTPVTVSLPPMVVAVGVNYTTDLTPEDAALYDGPNVDYYTTNSSGDAEDILLTRYQPNEEVYVVHHPGIRVTPNDPGACRLPVSEVSELGADGYVVGMGVKNDITGLQPCFP